MASAIPCGALSTKPITYWLAWGRATGTSTPPRSFRQLLKGEQDVPRVIIPEKRKRYGAAKRARASPGANPARVALLHHRWEHSQRPTRQRARRMQECKAAGQAQRLLSASGPMAQPCRPRRPLWSAAAYRAELRNRCERWAAITGSKRAA